MLIRKINNINGQRVRVSTLAVDPHGKLVCIYEHMRGEFIVIEICSIYKLFEQYRKDYFVNNCYDVKHQLPHLLFFKSEQILEECPKIKFSQIFQEEGQFLAIYYTTFVEIVKISLQTYEITFRVIFKLATQVLQLNVMGENIYISMYDGSIFNIHLSRIETKRKGDICRKISFITEGMRRQHIGISQSTRLEEDKSEGYKIWQTFNGRLMYNRTVISNQFEDNFDYETSFEEYLGSELNEMHPIKYEMSNCREYIIGCNLGKIINEKKAKYFIKARWSDWSHICEVSLKPQINPYWTAYQQYMGDQSNWGFPINKNQHTNGKTKVLRSYKTDKIMIAYYCPAQCSLVVSWIIVDKSLKKRLSNTYTQKEGKEQTVEQVKYSGTQQVILRISYLKSRISQMRWIGLNQLLTIDQDFNLLFVQFDAYSLRD